MVEDSKDNSMTINTLKNNNVNKFQSISVKIDEITLNHETSGSEWTNFQANLKAK